MSEQNYKTTPPTKDPNDVYPKVPRIDYNDFKLTSERMPQEQRQRALLELYEYETTQKSNFLGYQANQKLDFQEDLSQYLNYHINNIGDPFVSGNFTVNAKFAERAVLDYFASLWNAQWPHEYNPGILPPDWKNSYWGYVVSMGCTEANIYGLWNARDYLAGKFILQDPQAKEQARLASQNGRRVSAEPRYIYYQAKAPKENLNKYTPVAFYSQDAHYSIVKAMRVLSINTFNELGSGKFTCPLTYPDDYPEGFSEYYLDENKWPLEVPSDEDGSIYIPALAKLVQAFAEQGYPIIVNFNYGTTFKGAYDNVKKAIETLVPVLKANGLYEREVEYDKEHQLFDIRTGFWFHVDGALGAAYMPFLEMAEKSDDFPIFDFRIPELQSISMSGHKWIGAPWPCGIYMTKVKYQLLPPDDPMYIGAPDSTFAGSRNGFSPLLLWNYLSKNSYEDLINKVLYTQKQAQYALAKFQELERILSKDLWVEYSPRSLTVRFKKANDSIIFKYSLSGETLYVNQEERAYNHIYIMESVTWELIDRLIDDLKAPNAFPEQLQKEVTAQEEIYRPDAVKGIFIPVNGRGFK